jgi:tripartite-type tricarboxylate transporter receptor subunit TctC
MGFKEPEHDNATKEQSMTTSRQLRVRSAGKFTTLAAAALAACALWLTATREAGAQAAYPSQPVKLLVGFPAGTAPDTVARLLGDQLQKSLGQPVIVENVSGAGGSIAAHQLAKAEPDGHTLAVSGNAPVVIQQNLAKLPYDPEKELAPISQLVATPLVLAVTPGLAAKTPKELAELARGQPDKLIYAHAGIGTGTHLAPEMFKQVEGLSIRALAVRGAPYLEMMAGRVEVCFCVSGGSVPLMQDGKLRALAVTSPKRLPQLPQVPTMAEAGYPGFELTTPWFGLMAPAGTPAPIVERLHRESVKALAQAEVREKLTGLGMEVIGNSPQEFAAAIKTEIPYWQSFIQKIGLKQQ